MVQAFIQGILLSFGLILPLGAQNIFIFNQGALHRKWRGALPAVITASLCDTLLILLAVWGVSLLVLTLSWLKVVLAIVGVLFLLYIGWMIWNSDSDSDATIDRSIQWTISKQILFCMSVSLLNPHAILDTVGVIGTTSLSFQGNEKIIFTSACILVSWIWFLSLSILGRMIGSADRSGEIRRNLNRISAVLIWFSAIYLIYSLFFTSI